MAEADKQPECAWCGLPATEQIYMGTRYTRSGLARRYSWLCDQCIRETGREREVTIRA